MKILITNDDGYKARGLEALIEIMRPFGEITVVAPKYHQSGMSMAISAMLMVLRATRLLLVEQKLPTIGVPAMVVSA